MRLCRVEEAPAAGGCCSKVASHETQARTLLVPLNAGVYGPE